MRVVSRSKLKTYWERKGCENSEDGLKTWFDVASKAQWKSHVDVKAAFGANVDYAYGKYIFDIHGNDHRLICIIDFVRHGVLTLWLGSHDEYDELNKRDGEKLRQL